VVACEGQQPRFREGVDDAPEASPVHRPGAHGAGLGAAVQRRLRQTLRWEAPRGFAYGQQFRMAGCVSVRPAEGVAGLGQDLVAGIHDQRGEGVLAARLRCGGERDGVAQILQVTISGGSFHADLPRMNELVVSFAICRKIL